MPKYLVGLGRLVREQVTVVVEAPSAEAINPDYVYDHYEGLDWESDLVWGAEPSDSHDGVLGPAEPDAAVDVVYPEQV